MKEQFRRFCLGALEARVEEKNALWKKAEQDRQESARRLIALGFEMEELENLLKQAERLVDQTKVEEEFERILSWPNIKGMRIENSALVVYTNPLTMELSDGRNFLIGEYKIIINPKSDPNDIGKWVQVGEFGWRGPFSHNYIQGNNTFSPCWGSVLKPPLVQALQRYDFAYAISDALSFLTAEIGGAIQQPGRDVGSKPPDQAPFYRSEADKNSERGRYVDFARHFRKEILEDNLKKERAEKLGTLTEEIRKLRQARSRLDEESSALAFLERCHKAVPCDEEFALMVDCPDLVGLDVYQETIVSYIAPQFSSNDNALHGGFALILSKTGTVEIQRMGSGEKISLPALDVFQELFVSLAAFGLHGTIFRIIYEVLGGNPKPVEEEQKRFHDFIGKTA